MIFKRKFNIDDKWRSRKNCSDENLKIIKIYE